MRASRFDSIFAAVAIVGAMVAPSPPAYATVTGATIFHCTAMLVFPSQAPSAGTCVGDGLDPAIASGVATGLDDGSSSDGDSSQDAYVVTGAGAFRADFDYSEACTANGLPPLIGNAVGVARVNGATVVEVVEAPAPHVPVGTATLTTNFSWVRVGAVAVIVTGPTRLDFIFGSFPGDNDSATAATSDVAVAAFVPLLGAGNTCPVGGPLKAKVVGVDVNPA